MASAERDSDAKEDDFFRNWGVENLKSYLLAREVPIRNTNKQGLLNLATFPHKLGLKVVKSVEENQTLINNERLSKLKLEKGRITLPDPDTLTDGWEGNASNYPDVCQMNVKKYWDESNIMSHFIWYISCVKTAPYSLENNFYYQEVYLNTNFLEEAILKTHLFFKEVVVPDLLTGNVKKGMAMTAMCELVVKNELYTKESVVDFPCGKCGAECLEEPKECKEMSIGCDCKWFLWQCVNVTGNECFILDNLTWFCYSVNKTTKL